MTEKVFKLPSELLKAELASFKKEARTLSKLSYAKKPEEIFLHVVQYGTRDRTLEGACERYQDKFNQAVETGMHHSEADGLAMVHTFPGATWELFEAQIEG